MTFDANKIALKTGFPNNFDKDNNKIPKKTFPYNKSDLGCQVLEEAKKNLQVKDSANYKLLIKVYKSVYRFIDPDNPFSSMKPDDNTTLLVVKEEDAVKFTLNKTFSRTILVNVTIPLKDIMKSISDRLHYKCQYNQYSIWGADKEGKIIPFNSNLSIAEQTQDYRKLIFKRRYFLVFALDFAEFEEAKHIYRDMKQQYLEGLTCADIDQAVNLAYLMMYADFETADEAKEYVNNISNDPNFKFKSLLPKNHGKFHSDKFKKKFLQHFESNPPIEQFAAMDKFIRESRILKNFGDELYKCTLANKGEGVKCHMFIGPHGIQIMDNSETKEIEKIRILKIKMFKQKKRMIKINFSDEKNNDKSVSFSLSKVDFVTTMLSDSVSLIQNYYNSELDKQRKMAKGVSDEIQLAQGQYSTLDEAEAAIELFKAEMLKLDDVAYNNYGLEYISNKDEVLVDDYSKLNELESIKEFNPESNNVLLNNPPSVSIQHIIGNLVKKKLNAFLDEIKNYRTNSHQIKYSEITYFLTSTVNYLKSIEIAFPDFKLGPLLNQFYQSLKNNIQSVNSRYEKRKTQDISDLVSVFVEEYNKIITGFDSVKKHVEKAISSFPKLNEADKDSLSNISPKGQFTVISLLESILSFFDLAYSKKPFIFKANDIPSYQNIFLNASEYYPKIFQFADDLISGKLKEKDAISNRFNGILSIFYSLNPFIVDLNKSAKIQDDVKKELNTSITHIIKLFDILKCCCIGEGEFIESKCYLGTHSTLANSINCISEIEAKMKSLNQPSLKEKVTDIVTFINENLPKIKEFNTKLDSNPLDTESRFRTSQILQGIKAKLNSIYETLLTDKSDNNLIGEISSFTSKIEITLHSLCPDNCNLRRVDACAKSFSEIVDTIDEKHINENWTTTIKASLNKIKEYYPKLVNSPTDGVLLARIHIAMLELLQNVHYVKENSTLANHRTVPLILEISEPNILRALEDPLVTDEFERAEHLIRFNQMLFDLRQLINFGLTLISRPNVSAQKSLVNELGKHIKVLETIYVEYSTRRHDLLVNPYSYSLVLPILNMINHLKLTEANMIDISRKIDDINVNYALKKCLCQSMISAIDFIDSANKLKLRPYRKLFTVPEITEYRLNIINLVAFIKESALTQKGEHLKILEKESKQYMKFMVFIQKELKQPTHNFEFIVMNLNKFLNGIYARCNFHEFTSKREGIQKVEQLQQQNDKIILGIKPTPALLENLLHEMVKNMNSFHTLISKNPKLLPSITNIVPVWDKEFQLLLPRIKPFIHEGKEKISVEQIPQLRKILLEHLRRCPEPPSNLNEKGDDESIKLILNAYLSFDDCLNLTRQFPVMSTISLDYQPLEVSLGQEIQELGEVILEQYQTMSKLFTSQLIPHRLIQQSQRLIEFTTQLSLFFGNNYNLLNDNHENLEQFIEKFCRDTQLTFQVINKNVHLLNPLLTTDSLLTSCDALSQNIAKVISQFDKHYMTNQTAAEFIKSIVPDMLKLRESYKLISRNQLVSTEKELIEFLDNSSELITAMEKELENIKPSQLQQHCDKIYNYFGEKVPLIENQMDEVDIYIPTVLVYNKLLQYTSLSPKRIYISAPLIIKQQIIGQEELTNIFNSKEFNNELFEQLISNKKYLPAYIITMIRYLIPNLSTKKSFQNINIKSLLCLALTEVNYDDSNKQIQKILIDSSCLSSSLLEDVRKEAEKIDKLTDEASLSKKTIYQSELLNLLRQIDTTTLTQLKTIPAFLMSYTNYKEVSFLLPLVQPGNDNFRKIAESYINIMNEVNLLLANNIMILFDHLINSLEIQDRNLDFVYGMVELLHNPLRGVTFDQQKLSKASDLYIKFEAANSSEISKFAMSFDKMAEAKNLIQLLNQYKPILIQWASLTTTDATQPESLFIKSIQSPISLLMSQLEPIKSLFPKNPIKVPLLFSLPREEINQIIYYISLGKDKPNGADCSKYSEIIKYLEDDLVLISKDSKEIFNEYCYEAANIEFGSIITEVCQNIQKLNQIVGPIEIEKKQEIVHEEEETVHEVQVVEQKVVKIDTFKSVLNLYKSLASRKYDSASEIVDLLRENIDNYPELESLRQVFEDARMYLDFNQNSELDKLKKPLLDYLNSHIDWQTNITSRISSPSSITNELIEIQHRANEISNQYLDSSNKEDLLIKIAKEASDAQALVVHSFRFYKIRTNQLYTDLYQNSVQIWKNILSLFDNPSEDFIKRCFRSIRRLLADLSYFPDDLSYINSSNYNESDDSKNNSEFQKSLKNIIERPAALFNDTASIISLFANSPVRELYDMNFGVTSKPFNDHYGELSNASKQIYKLNNRERPGKVFQTRRKHVKNSFESFITDISANPTTLKNIIQSSQNLHTDLQSLCASAKNMSDVTVRHPDFESVAILPSRVTIPTNQNELTELNKDNNENSFKTIFSNLQKLIEENQNRNEEFRNFLFDAPDSQNSEVATHSNEYIQFIQKIVSHILLASNNTTNISIAENLAASASSIVHKLEQFNKAIKGKFLLKKDWKDDVNNSLDSIIEEFRKVQKSCEKEIELSEIEKQQKDDEARRIRTNLDQSGTALKSSKATIEKYSSELNKDSNTSINIEWCKDLCKLALNSSASLIKAVVFLSEHPKEILTDAEKVLESSQKVPELTNQFIDEIKKIAAVDINDMNSVEFESEAEVAAKMIKPIAEILKPHFSPSKNAEAKVIENTIDEIVRGAESLAETAQNMKKTKLEKIESRKKRQQEIEERKKITSSNPGKSQEQLLKKLDLQSKIIQTKMLEDYYTDKMKSLA